MVTAIIDLRDVLSARLVSKLFKLSAGSQAMQIAGGDEHIRTNN